MGWFLGLGIAGLVLLVLAVVLDGVFDGVLDLDVDGLLSLPAVAAFVSMLGFAGAITLQTTGLGAPFAAAVGAAAGGGTAWLVTRFSAALLRDQSTVAPREEDLVGLAGAVVTAIPGDGKGFGEVLLNVSGLRVKYAARCERALPVNAEVWVVETLSPAAVEVRATR